MGPEASTSELKVILFTDLAGSTAFKQKHGDRPYAKFITEHNRLFRKLLAECRGTEVQQTGDGFFASFERPSEACACALEFIQAVAGIETPDPLQVRAGIHLGEVMRTDEPEAPIAGVSAGMAGLAIDTAARVQSLALPDQVLLTRGAFDSARQVLGAELGGRPLAWLAHGPYLFKGVDEPLEIYEAGLQGLSPLRVPADSEKARSATAIGDEITLGWRPAPGQAIPGREQWMLEKKLGQGGFGEVWLARHAKTRELRCFKFCFKADSLRTLKRELSLFRLIKEVLGERQDIARLYDVNLEKPPFWLEMEYTAGGDLNDWAAGRGGLAAMPLPLRLEIAAQTAEALSAAHSVGVIHKDVKPSNILIDERKDGSVQVRLTDFGIGQLVNREALAEAGITMSGFTQGASAMMTDYGSRTGTRLYMAPELLVGAPASTQSDIYSLGVLLYQIVSAHFDRPLGQGWERDIPDELLREDVGICVECDMERRLRDAGELASRLRALETRRAELAARRLAEQNTARATRLRRAALWAVPALLLLLAGASAMYWRQRQLYNLALEAIKSEEVSRRQRTEAYNSQQEITAWLTRHMNGMFDALILQGQYDLVLDKLGDAPLELRNQDWKNSLVKSVPYIASWPATRRRAVTSPDGRIFLSDDSGSTATPLAVRRTTDSALLWQGGMLDNDKFLAAFSADGKRLAVACPGAVEVRQAADGALLAAVPSEGGIAAAPASQASELALLFPDRIERWTWDAGPPVLRATHLMRSGARPGSEALFNGLINASNLLYSRNEAALFALARKPGAKHTQIARVTPANGEIMVYRLPIRYDAVILDSQGEGLIATTNSGEINFFDLPGYDDFNFSINEGDIPPPRDYCVLNAEIDTIRFKIATRFQSSKALAISPDQRRLIETSWDDASVTLWDLETLRAMGARPPVKTAAGAVASAIKETVEKTVALAGVQTAVPGREDWREITGISDGMYFRHKLFDPAALPPAAPPWVEEASRLSGSRLRQRVERARIDAYFNSVGLQTPKQEYFTLESVASGNPEALAKLNPLEMTFAVSKELWNTYEVENKEALTYIGADADGARAIFAPVQGQLVEFDVERRTSVPVEKVINRYWCCTKFVGTNLYIIGGRGPAGTKGPSEIKEATEIWDSVSRRLTTGPPLPRPRRSAGSAVVEGKIYILGGGVEDLPQGRGELDRVDVLDTAAGTWSDGPPLPLARECCAVAVGKKIYVPGGYNRKDASAANRFDVLDTESGRWEQLPPIPFMVGTNSAVHYKGHLFTFGSYERPDQVLGYSIEKKLWRKIYTGFQPSRHNAAVVSGGRVYVIGGHDRDARQVSIPIRGIQMFEGDELITAYNESRNSGEIRTAK